MTRVGGWAADLQGVEQIGRDRRTGGYHRFAWSAADSACREWFTAAAAALGLDVEVDRCGNLWAWWGDPAADGAVVTGSHLDSVPGGGAYDGPLGVVSAFAAVAALQADGTLQAKATRPGRPLAVVAFADEEGARFGTACVGSRLLTGALDPDRTRGLRDDDGITMAEAMAAAGHDPARVGADPDRLARIGAFVELHIEQGRALADTAYPVGVGSEIWPHGRWRLELPGRGDHAGTTRLADRDDPMLPLARTILAAREAADAHGCLATIGRVAVQPGGTNVIPSAVTAWLDARGPEEDGVRRVVDQVHRAAGDTTELTQESFTPATRFDAALADRVAALLGGAPRLPTGAGHDAGILAAAGVPTAMLYVRNPTGVSHSPAEHAEPDDCAAGVAALTRVLADLL